MLDFKMKEKKFTGPKAINQKQLAKQNLIFLGGAGMMIAILIVLIVSRLSFLLSEINQGVRVEAPKNNNQQGFNLTGFNEIKEKVLAPALTTPTPIIEEEEKL